jgi:hypothetical protein
VIEHDEAGTVVGDDGVGKAVAVDVADREPLCLVVGGVRHRREGFRRQAAIGALQERAEPHPSTVQHDDVFPTVPVDVGDLDGLGDVVGGQARRRIQAPPVVLAEDRNERRGAVAAAGEHGVAPPVAVHVPDGHPVGQIGPRHVVVGRRVESPARLLEEDGEVGAEPLPAHDDDVVPAVRVHVPHVEVVPSLVGGGIAHRRVERSRGGLQEDRHVGGRPGQADHVGAAVAVEVARLHQVGVGGRYGDHRVQRAERVLEQDPDRVVVGHDHVEAPVAVHVAEGERAGAVRADGVPRRRGEGTLRGLPEDEQRVVVARVEVVRRHQGHVVAPVPVEVADRHRLRPGAGREGDVRHEHGERSERVRLQAGAPRRGHGPGSRDDAAAGVSPHLDPVVAVRPQVRPRGAALPGRLGARRGGDQQQEAAESAGQTAGIEEPGCVGLRLVHGRPPGLRVPEQRAVGQRMRRVEPAVKGARASRPPGVSPPSHQSERRESPRPLHPRSRAGL